MESGIPEKLCYKAGTSIMRRGSDHDDGLRVNRRSGISVVPAPQARPGGNGRTARTLLSMRLDPTLRRFGVPSLSYVMYLLETGVRDASKLIDPRNPPRHQGERVCCLLVLNSVTSPPQWIRQQKLRGITVGAPLLWTGILTGSQLTLSRH